TGQLRGPEDVPRKIVEWEMEQRGPMDPREREVAKQLNTVLSELAESLTDQTKRMSTALVAYMEDKDPMRRLLGIRSLAAIDSVDVLLDALGRENLKRDDVRREALTGLRIWLSRGQDQASRLYDRKKMTGL